MTVREMSEQIESQILSEQAAKSSCSAGRELPEEPCEYRTDFQQDRDRILHCKAFRRLKHKTQVFISPQGDHYRTRLTHTLEVSQIARTVARGLRLNEDLTEAIALGHDLGHTPFGHAGERTLSALMDGGFAHYEQSARVVQKLERGGKGLNLCAETVDGIRCHTKGKEADTLEGRIVKLADHIAFINHDIEDAVSAGILTEGELPFEAVAVLGTGKSARISAMVGNMIQNGGAMCGDVHKAYTVLKDFMYQHVYVGSLAKVEEGKACALVETLFQYYVNDPDKLPQFYLDIAKEEGVKRGVADYISGMTDPFATKLYGELFLPKSWNL